MSIIVPGGGSSVPSEIQDRLKLIDQRLYIQPTQRTIFDSGAEYDRPSTEWMWYVVLKWPENDPRWRMVQNGQVSPDMAFDLLGQIPIDCPLDQVPGYLSKQLRTRNGHPAKIVNDVAAWNEDQSLRNGAASSEFAQELFEANANTLFRDQGKSNPKPVYQTNPVGKNRPKEAS